MSVDVAKPCHSYYIVFSDSKLKGLKWLRTGFQHCAVVRNEYGRLWTVIQDGYNRMSVSTHLIEEYPDPLMLFDGNSTIIPVEIEDKDRYRGTLCLFNCVEVCKAVLGIRKTFIFTPYQLYRYLLCQTQSRVKAKEEMQGERQGEQKKKLSE